jgi:hypothetical protein
MTTSSPSELAPFGQPARFDDAKVWTVRLRTAIRTPAEGWPFMQLPPGEYTLHERSTVHYELRICEDFSCYFRLRELETLRAAGDLAIDGSWPH